MLLPFVVVTVDLFARCRRRKIPVAPALRAYRSRLGFWLWAGRDVPVPRARRRLARTARRARSTPRPLAAGALAGRSASSCCVVLAVPGWLVSRARLAPRKPATAEEELAGHTAAMLALGVVALLVVATNAFALLFLLPSLHVWLWLPQVRDRGPGASGRPARRRTARPVHPRRLVHVPLRARPRCALVPCGTRSDRLRIDCGLPSRPLLAGRGGAADRLRSRPLRAVSVAPPSGRRAARSGTASARSCSPRAPETARSPRTTRRWGCRCAAQPGSPER